MRPIAYKNSDNSETRSCEPRVPKYSKQELNTT